MIDIPFWEKLGFEHRYLNVWIFPDGRYGKIPDEDSLEFMGFLFKWAVTKVTSIELKTWTCEPHASHSTAWSEKEIGMSWNQVPAIALKEAISKALGGTCRLHNIKSKHLGAGVYEVWLEAMKQ